MWEAMNEGGTGLAVEKRFVPRSGTAAKRVGKRKLGNKRNMGGDGNEFHRSSGSPSANAVEFLPGWRVETLHHARKLKLLFLVPETSGEQSGASISVSSPLDALEASAGSCDGEAGNAAFLHPLPDIVTEEFDKHLSYCRLFCCPFRSLSFSPTKNKTSVNIIFNETINLLTQAYI